MKTLFISFLVFLSAVSAQAQYRACNQEIGVGGGVFSSEQILDGTSVGILEPTMKKYTNNTTTGVWFADYKYFVTKSFTIGVFAGMQKEAGDWYFDDVQGKKPDNWSSYKIGTFSRTAYTIAAECSFAYTNREDVRMYSTFGVGATFKRETDVYDLAYYNAGYYNGVNQYGNVSQPNNPTKFDAYYSPLGMSFGGRLRGFFELGIGYKGILNGGICYKLNTSPKRLEALPAHTSDPVILMPHDLPFGGYDLTMVDHVRSGGRPSRHNGGFGVQLDKVISAAHGSGGNVLRISSSLERGDADRYSIQGTAYYTTKYDSLKRMVDAEKAKKFNGEQCAYVVIYCSDMGKPALLKLKSSVTINDTGSVLIGPNTRYILKLTKEGVNVIKTDKNKITIHAKFGQCSYIKLHVLPRRTWAQIVDEVQGEVESSLIEEGGSAE